MHNLLSTLEVKLFVDNNGDKCVCNEPKKLLLKYVLKVQEN